MTDRLLLNLAGLLAFVSLALASFVVGYASSGMWRLYSIASGGLLLVLFVVTGVLAERAVRGAEWPVGITQRAAIVAGWTWAAHFAIHLCRT